MSAPPIANPPKLSELPLVIETSRLRLRPFAQGDVEALWPHVSDPELPRQMSWNAHADREETRAFIESSTKATADNEGVTWAIEHAGTLVGAIGLHDVRFQRLAWRIDRAELGYWMGIPYQRQGFMTEAASAVVEFGFDTLRLHKITVGCLDKNEGSRKVIERLGFRFIGRHESDVWRDEKWHAHLRYELLASAWSDITTTMPISMQR